MVASGAPPEPGIASLNIITVIIYSMAKHRRLSSLDSGRPHEPLDERLGGSRGVSHLEERHVGEVVLLDEAFHVSGAEDPPREFLDSEDAPYVRHDEPGSLDARAQYSDKLHSLLVPCLLPALDAGDFE